MRKTPPENDPFRGDVKRREGGFFRWDLSGEIKNILALGKDDPLLDGTHFVVVVTNQT